MKRTITLFLGVLLGISGAIAQDADGAFINFSLMGVKANRPNMDAYVKVLSDTLNLDPALKPNNGYGLNAAFITRKNKFEFELGGYVTKTHYTTSMDLSGDIPIIKCGDIEIHMGANYLPVNWLIFGAHLLLNAEQNNQLKNANSASVTSPESNVDLNIFRGYSFGVKAIAGLNIPLSKKGNNFIRITPFYQLGISKYNYYKAFDNYLANYSGDKKTRISQTGILVGLVFKIKDAS
ncbi:MAG: hypothetical protein HXX13_16595 [Bacteroidetes bacterium]|nr:hypothetical protein [Bacteroidota bacterium]